MVYESAGKCKLLISRAAGLLLYWHILMGILFFLFLERERAMGIPVWAFLLFLDNGKNSGFKPL